MPDSRPIGVACALALALALAQALALTHAPVPPRTERTSLEGFDFRRRAATQLRLPPWLREISDLTVTADGRLLAVGDERGVVAELDPRRGTIVKTFSLGSPPIRDDFEGLAVADGRIFLLTSTGRLYETREGADGTVVPYTTHDTGLRARCELEGLAYEPSDRSLVLACKQSFDQGLRDAVTLWRWPIAGREHGAARRVSVPMAAVTRGMHAQSFNPSAVAREPRSGHYVLIAGRQRILAELTPDGRVVAIRELDHRLHPQPEGIAFLGDSAVIISDEGGSGHATLTRYSRVR
jgi:uncharacterized protein YjiK